MLVLYFCESPVDLLSSVVLCAGAMACGALPLEAIKKIEKKIAPLRPPENTGERDGRKASSCEQPVGVVRAAHSAPLAARSGWTEVLSSGRASQPTFFAL